MSQYPTRPVGLTGSSPRTWSCRRRSCASTLCSCWRPPGRGRSIRSGPSCSTDILVSRDVSLGGENNHPGETEVTGEGTPYFSKSFLDFSDQGSFSDGRPDDMAADVVSRERVEGVVVVGRSPRSTEAEAGVWGEVVLCKRRKRRGVPGAHSQCHSSRQLAGSVSHGCLRIVCPIGVTVLGGPKRRYPQWTSFSWRCSSRSRNAPVLGDGGSPEMLGGPTGRYNACARKANCNSATCLPDEDMESGGLREWVDLAGLCQPVGQAPDVSSRIGFHAGSGWCWRGTF